MALPTWPVESYRPQEPFNGLQRMRDPLTTEMEGGNIRSRPRPGDNVGTVVQTIWMSADEYQVFVAWVKTTLNNGTARFTMNVFLGVDFEPKVCQFRQPGTKLTYDRINFDTVAVNMTLLVYDV